MPTIQEVAKVAGVSTSTVSRTFSNPDLLNNTTRRHVQEVAAKLHYRPRNRMAKSELQPMEEATASIGFLFFASDQDGSQVSEFYLQVLMGAQAEAAKAGLHLILRTASRYEIPTEMPIILKEQATAGILLVGAAVSNVLNSYTDRLRTSVVVDNYDERGQHDCVISDGFGGMYEATKYLIELGHEKIAFVQDEITAPSFRDRRRGYLCALIDAGLAPQSNWTVSVPRHGEFDPYLTDLLTSPDRPTAIVAANDRNAISVLAASRKHGLRVPEDLSIIGFDDSPLCTLSVPALTSVAVNKEQMGRLAIRHLVARIEEKKSRIAPLSATQIVVPVKLIRRDSCSHPPSKK